jgi:hypothetical protein
LKENPWNEADKKYHKDEIDMTEKIRKEYDDI